MLAECLRCFPNPQPSIKSYEWLSLTPGEHTSSLKAANACWCRNADCSSTIGTNFVVDLCQPHPHGQGRLSIYYEIANARDEQAHASLFMLTRMVNRELDECLIERHNLGYYNDAGIAVHGDTLFWTISIHSAHDPAYMERLVDAFLEETCKLFSQMDEAAYEAFKQTVVHSLQSFDDGSFITETATLARCMVSNPSDPFTHGESQ